MGFRAMKLDESIWVMPKLTGWGNEKAKPERRQVGFGSRETEGGISTPNAAGSSRMWTED